MKRIKQSFLLVIVVLIGISSTNASAQTIGDYIKPRIESELADESNKIPGKAIVLVYSNTSWSGNVSGGDLGSSTKEGYGDAKFVVSCGDLKIAQGLIQKQTEDGFVAVAIIQNGQLLAIESTNAQFGIAHTVADCQSFGGCLVATAAFGTELSPQVQLLREVRDNVLFSTGSGTAFMAGFNNVYYAFSPAVADLERQNPLFKEVVKTTITPMLSTLSILNYANIDSEQEMLGYGIGIILLNIGMYFVAPTIIIVKLRQKFRKI